MTESNRSVLTRTFVLGSANILGSGLGFLSVLVMIHHFGAHGFGMIQLAMTLLSYAAIATLCGTDLYAVQNAAGNPERMERLIGGVITLRLILGTGAYLVLMALVYAVPQFRDVRLLTALFGLAVFNSAFTLRWVPQALHRTNILAAVELEMQALWLASLWFVLQAVPELWVVAVTRLGAELVVAVRLWVWSRVRGRVHARRPSMRNIRRLFLGAFPIGMSQLLRSVTLGSDLLLLGLLVSRVELGHYAAAFRIFGLLMAVSASYFIVLLPRLAERARQPAPALTNEVQASLRRIVPLALAGGAILIILASPVLGLLFGDSFIEAAPSLRILAVAVVVNVVRHHYRLVMLTTGRQRLDMRQTAFAGVVHITSKLALIPWLGITGAAFGTLSGETFFLALQWRATRNQLRYDHA